MEGRRKVPQPITRDKCHVCGWVGPSDDVIEWADNTYHCPVCDSQDLDDISADPYDDDDDDDDPNDEDDNGSPVWKSPVLDGPFRRERTAPLL